MNPQFLIALLSTKLISNFDGIITPLILRCIRMISNSYDNEELIVNSLRRYVATEFSRKFIHSNCHSLDIHCELWLCCNTQYLPQALINVNWYNGMALMDWCENSVTVFLVTSSESLTDSSTKVLGTCIPEWRLWWILWLPVCLVKQTLRDAADRLVSDLWLHFIELEDRWGNVIRKSRGEKLWRHWNEQKTQRIEDPVFDAF